MESLPISKVRPNSENPRYIKDEKFKKLVKSLRDFPEMANVRPIVVNTEMVVLGGNMRLKAMQEAGWKEVPVQVVDWSEEKQREFIIKDNVGFGEWDWDELANTWDAEDLKEWGLDVWQGHSVNDMSEDELDLTEEFDAIGTATGLQRVVFIFDGPEEAESWVNTLDNLQIKKVGKAWTIDLSTPSI